MEKETLYRYVACQASPEEETAVLTWLEADPAHESELAKVQRQHDLVALSAPVINELYAKDRRRRFGSVLRRWSAAAAAVVLLAFGGYYFHAARDFSRQGERLLSVSVPHGQRVSLTLQDGTSVWLNAGTTLRYPALFTGRERRVEIDGEARFEVVHDAKHPFIVRTYACDVEVWARNSMSWPRRRTDSSRRLCSKAASPFPAGSFPANDWCWNPTRW